MKPSIAPFAIATLLLPLTANAYDSGDIIVRTGPTFVAPDASSSELVLNTVGVGQSQADVDNELQLGITITYMLNEQIGLEVLASTPFQHRITADTGTLGLGQIDAGKTKHLPPTLSLQYFPTLPESRFQPYVGVGLNYTLFFQEDVDSELEAVLGRGSLKLKNSLGIALQAGMDYEINDNLLLNLGIRWIDIDTEAEFDFATDQITTDVDIDPWVYSLSLGWKF